VNHTGQQEERLAHKNKNFSKRTPTITLSIDPRLLAPSFIYFSQGPIRFANQLSLPFGVVTSYVIIFLNAFSTVPSDPGITSIVYFQRAACVGRKLCDLNVARMPSPFPGDDFKYIGCSPFAAECVSNHTISSLLVLGSTHL
jgi:hypothetical protein